jgi:hypothetical protein
MIFDEPVVSSPLVPYARLGTWLRHYLPGLPFFRGEALPADAQVDRDLSLDILTSRWIRLLCENRPDVIVADCRPELFWAAAALRIPLFGVVSYVWSEEGNSRFGEPGRTTDERETDQTLLHRFNEVGEWRGLRPAVDCWEPFRGQKSLVPDAREFAQSDCDWSLTLGAQIWDPGCEGVSLPLILQPLGSPLAYVTSGSSHFDIMEDVAKRLATMGVGVVLSGGARQTTGSFGRQDRLLSWHGLAPGCQLASAADVVVCHGGSQTLYQAARSGTFAYVIPQHFDHERNGRMFASHGLAAAVSSSEPKAIANEIVAKLRVGIPRVSLAKDPPPDHRRLVEFLEMP